MPSAKEKAESLLVDLHEKLYQSDEIYEESCYVRYDEFVDTFVTV